MNARGRRTQQRAALRSRRGRTAMTVPAAAGKVTGVVLGAPSAPDHPLPERRGHVVHALAATWPGPACNNGFDQSTGLRTGILVDAERVTCWGCRHPDGEPCTDPTCGPCHPSGGLTRA